MTKKKTRKLSIIIFFALAMMIVSNSIAAKVTAETFNSNPAQNLVNKNYYKLLKNRKIPTSSDTNLIKNSSFEQFDVKTGTFPEWPDWEKQSTPSVDAASGNRTLKVTYHDKPTWDQTIIRCFAVQKLNISPGNYSFSCKVKSSNLTKLIVQLLSKDDKSFKSSCHSFRLTGNKTDSWRTYQTNLKVPNGVKIDRIVIYFWGKRAKGGSVLLDDVKLFSKSVVANVIFNSSFEICTVPEVPDRWHSESGAIYYPSKYAASLDNRTAKTGSNSIKLSFHGPFDEVKGYYSRFMSGFYPAVSVGEPYTVSFWMKTNNPPVKMNLQMNWVNKKTFVIDSKEWKQYSFTAIWRRPERKTRNGILLFTFAGGKGTQIDADVWLDNIMAQPGTVATAWQPSPSDKAYLDMMFAQKSIKKSQKTGSNKSLAALKVSGNEITIDGKLNEQVWSSKSVAQCRTPFKNKTVQNSTSCRIAYDDKYLYVAIDAKRIAGKYDAKNSKGAFDGDWVEVFIDPNSEDNSYYQFALNYAGNIFTTKCLFDPIAFEVPGLNAYSPIDWRPKFDYVVTSSPTGWQAELKLPLNLFDKELATDKPFKLNFYRVIPAAGEANCWSKPLKGFHEIPLFGTLLNFNATKQRELKLSVISYLPSVDGKSVMAKMLVADNVKNITAKIVGIYHKTKALSVTKKGAAYTFNIPLAPQQAAGKLVRIIAQTNSESFQDFSTVEISTLLTLGVDTILFTDEKVLSCGITVKLPPSEWAQSTLNISVINRTTNQAVVRREVTIKQTSGVYKIPLLNATPGWYDVVVELKQAGKLIANEKRWTYISQQNRNYVSISAQNNCLEKNGKPFFPLSLWVSMRNPQCNIDIIKKYKELGCNTIIIPVGSYFSKYKDFNFDRIFSAAKEQNLAVIVDFTKLLVGGIRRHGYSKKQIINIICDFVTKYKDHPNLLMYHIMDEPGVQHSRKRPFSSPQDLQKIYWMIKQLDPYHPCFNNLSPRIWAWNDLSSTDIFSYDCYNNSRTPYKTDMDRVLYYLRAGEQCATENVKPMMNVIMFSDCTEIRNSRMLNYDEQRCLAYLHILHGSKGLFFYSELSWCESKNNQLLPIFSEMKTLAPVLLNSTKQVRLDLDTKAVEAKYFEQGDERWIICVNSSSQEFNSVLNLGKLVGNAQAKPLFNGKEVSVKNGKLKLNFPPYGCFVYKLQN